ncbi:MAG: hypothetical protein MI919_28475 [Holophagales bacterium]|nr:hypothetical protein [Holophagales bacterium]
MDLPADVQVSNEQLGIKGGKGVLVQVSPLGYYEMRLTFNNRQHKVLLPIQETSIIFRQPEPEFAPDMEIER